MAKILTVRERQLYVVAEHLQTNPTAMERTQKLVSKIQNELLLGSDYPGDAHEPGR